MGAEFNFEKLKAKDRLQAEREVARMIRQAAWDFGHSGYTGTLAEVSGFVMTNEEFNTPKEAFDWLESNAEKWGPALGVKVGEDIYIGALCSS